MISTFSLTAEAQEEKKSDPALDLYFNANSLFNRGYHPLAEAKFKEFLEKHKGHAKEPAVRLGLAFCHYYQKEYEEAIPLLDALVRDPKSPMLPKIALTRAQSFTALKRLPDAERAYTEALAIPGADEVKQELLAGLTDTLYQQQKWDDVAKRSAELASAAPTGKYTARAKFQGALAHHKSGRFKEAADLLTTLRTPDGQPIFGQQSEFLLAECMRESGNLEAAAEAYAKAADLDGGYADQALYRLGFINYKQGDYDATLKAFERLEKEHKDSPLNNEGALFKGRAYLEKKDYNRAQSTLAKAPGAEAAYWRAKCYSRQNNSNEAAKILQDAVGKYSDDDLIDDLYFDLGQAYLVSEKYKEAADAFTQLIAASADSPRVAESRRWKAYALHQVSDYENSLNACRDYLRAHSGEDAAAEIRFFEAENLFLLERFDESIPVYQQCLKDSKTEEQVNAAHYRIGQVHYQAKRWKEASDSFANLNGKDTSEPLYKNLPFFSAECAFQADDKPRAIAAYEDYLKKFPKGDHAASGLAKIAFLYEESDDADKAIESLARLTKDFSDSPQAVQAFLNIGRLQYREKNHGEAKRAFEEFNRRVPKDKENELRPNADYYLGYIAIDEKKPDDAIKFFAAVADRNPTHKLAADARLQEGIIHIQQESFPEAEKSLSRFLNDYKEDDRRARAHHFHGVALAQQEKFGEAEKAFSESLNADPKGEFAPKSLFQSAWCAKRTNNLDSASQLFAKLISEFPDNDLSKAGACELADIEYDQEKYDEAISRLRPVVAGNPEHKLLGKANYRLGWCHWQKGEELPAVEAFEAVLTKSPESEDAPTAAYQAGEARLKLREYGKALEHFKVAYEKSAEGIQKEQSLLRTGQCQAFDEKHADAERTYTEFLQKYPDSLQAPRAAYGIGWALENQGQHEEAITHYQAVLAKGGKDDIAARSQFQLGECYFTLKRYDDAIAALNNVETSFAFPELSATALYEMGRVLEAKEDPDAAKAIFEEILKKYPTSTAADGAKAKLKDSS